MNLYEAVKSNTKKYNLIHADSDKISELEKGSAFTWEGLSSDDNSLSQVVDFFTKESKGFKVPCDIYWWSGQEFDDKYGLTGDNRYPDDLTFISIPLDMWSEMGNLPMLKFQVGARWLDDIVDNNARREGRENFNESKEETKMEYQRYCDDVGIDSKKKSSKNRFIKDYGKHQVTMNGLKDFNNKVAQVKKDLQKEAEDDSIDLISYSIEQINKILEEIKETGVANQHLNNAIDLLFALKLELEMSRKGFK